MSKIFAKLRGHATNLIGGLGSHGGLILISIVVLGAVLAVNTYTAIQRQREFMRTRLLQKGISIAQSLEAGTRMGRRMSSAEDIFKSLLEELAKAEGVAFIALVSKEGKFVAHSRPELVGSPLSLAGYEERLRMGEAKLLGPGNRAELFMAMVPFNHFRFEPPPGMEARGMMPMRASAFPLEEGLRVAVGLEGKLLEKDRASIHREIYLTAALLLLLGSAAIYFSFLARRYAAARLSVGRLERVKAEMGKFLPRAVSGLIEKDPEGASLEKREADLSVMFLDLAGYSRLSEKLEQGAVNELVERYFSSFLDSIYSHGGDINETAGDGLMALFLAEDEKEHALSAVRAALAVRERLSRLNQELQGELSPLEVKIGINSGRTFLGSTHFRGTTGDRFTYTASGPVTNLAARLADLGQTDAILLGPETARRVRGAFPLAGLGEVCFKNIAEPVSVFRVE